MTLCDIFRNCMPVPTGLLPYRCWQCHAGWHTSVAKYRINDVTKQCVTYLQHYNVTWCIVNPVVKGILKEDDDGNLIEKRDKFHFKWVIIPPFNEVKRGYTGFTLSVCGQNRVRSVSSTILVGFISYLHILSSNFRRYVACKVCFKIQKFGIQFDPIV